MRHRVRFRKFSRKSAARMAMMVSLAESLVIHEGINTTLEKAKDLRPYVEKLITKAVRFSKLKRDLELSGNVVNENTVNNAPSELALRRYLLAKFRNRVAAPKKIVEDLGNRYIDRPGGYCRILKLGFRVGDAAPIARIELLPSLIRENTDNISLSSDESSVPQKDATSVVN